MEIASEILFSSSLAQARAFEEVIERFYQRYPNQLGISGSSKSPFKDASQDWTDFWGDAAMDILSFVSKVVDEFDLVKKTESSIFGLKCICFSIESSRLLEVMEEYHQYW